MDKGIAKTERVELPARLANLGKRILALPPGRHMIMITVPDGRDDKVDYTITTLGKVER